MKADGSLATVLFTDIVDSTKRAAELGNRGWQALLQRHDAVVRRELRGFGGREVSTAGDAFLATFDEPVPAIRCACAIRDSVRELGLEIRSGLHMGQVDRTGKTVGGIAVHIGARVASLAGPGEVLVSSTVRDAVEGAGFRFEDRGAHVLKGVPEEWRLFAVTGLPAEAAVPVRGRRLTKITAGRGVLAGVAGFALLFVLAGLYIGLREGGGITNPETEGPAKERREASLTPASLAAHRQLTFLGDAQMPAISPDGRSFVYISGKFGGEKRLLVQDLAGGQPLELTRGRYLANPRWSPDGSELLFIQGAGVTASEVFIVPRFGGAPRRVAGHGAASWSADGTRIVSIGRTSMGRSLSFTKKSTGDTSSVALRGYFGVNDLDYSPRGDRVAFLTIDDRERYAIWTIRPDGSEQHKVLEDSLMLLSPRWSPKGNAIYYLRDKEQTKDLMRLTISPASGRPEGPASTLLTGLQAGDDLTLSRDGKQLLYTGGIKPPRSSWYGWYSNLLLVSVAPKQPVTSNRQQLTTGTAVKWLPSFSSDGKRVAVAVGGYRTANIFVVSLEDGSTRQLTFLNGFSSGPVWSPDGSEIAFGSNHGGPLRVWIVNAEGGTPRPFEGTELAESYQMTWAPGSEILYQLQGSGHYNVLDPASGEQSALVPSESERGMGFPRYSPDGKKVAVLWDRPPSGIWVISLQDSSHRLIREQSPRLSALNEVPEIPMGWSADGKSVYAWGLGTSNILRIPIRDGAAEVALTLPCEEPVPWVTMAPDGKRFLCDVGEAPSDIWLVENFDPEVP